MDFILYQLNELNERIDLPAELLPLSLRMYADGSGAIVDFANGLVFEFDTINHLRNYLMIKSRFGGVSNAI